MNPTLSAHEIHALLLILYRGLLAIRLSDDLARSRDVADALHNLPALLGSEAPSYWTVDAARRAFLEPLAERYPDLQRILAPLDAGQGRGA